MNLAIIIPTLNNKRMLNKLVKQIEEYTERYSLMILPSRKMSIAQKWNAGIEMCHDATHFAIMNDDIELYPSWWKDCKKAFDKGAELVSLTAGNQLKLTRRAVPIAGWFFILSKSVIDKVGLFDEKIGKFIGEDTDYGIRCGLKGIKYELLDLPIKHHGSTTLKKLDQDVVSQASKDSFQYLRNKYPELRFMS